MAIDTAQKRRSAAGNGSMPGGPGVKPQAAKSAAWRRDVAWTYSGNASGYTPTGTHAEWLIRKRRRLGR